MHYIGKFSIFSVFPYFHENWKFSMNISTQDRILLENMKIGNFSVNITERNGILLENLIFSTNFIIFMKTVIFQAKKPNSRAL